jgi:hypothetical protein
MYSSGRLKSNEFELRLAATFIPCLISQEGGWLHATSDLHLDYPGLDISVGKERERYLWRLHE